MLLMDHGIIGRSYSRPKRAVRKPSTLRIMLEGLSAACSAKSV